MDFSATEKTGVLAPAETAELSVDPQSEYQYNLPEKPLVVLEPSGSFSALDLKGIWKYRELLYFLTLRDIKIRYKQTALGALWAILQPLMLMLIFSIFFGRVAKLDSNGLPYPLFAYGGLLPWTFFSNAITTGGNSLVGSSHLITKIYFPRMIIPGAAVGASLVDLFISFLLLIPLMFYYHIHLSWHLVALPIFILLSTLLALGVGMWMSGLNVKYRDIRFALPFLVQVWFFCSPIIYSWQALPPKLKLILTFNPMTGIIDGFRSALFGQTFEWVQIGIAAVITMLMLVFAAYSFRRMEKRFADIV